MSSLKKNIYASYSSAKVNKDGRMPTVKDATNWAKHTFTRVKKFLPADKNANLLDIATGTGNFLVVLKNAGYSNLTGLDLSKEQIDIAKKIIPEANLYNSDLFEFLSDKENQYDLISGFDIIEHFTRDEAYNLLLNVNKALKNSGRIILQTPNAYSPWSGAVCYGDLTHEWFYTPNSLDDLLIQCGFHKYTAVEVAPVCVEIKGYIRAILWWFIRLFYKILNSLEIGSTGKEQIFSRVFICTAVKKDTL